MNLRRIVRDLLGVPAWLFGIPDRRRRRKGQVELSTIAIVLAYIPGRLGEIWRTVYYSSVLAHVGQNVHFKFGTFCQYNSVRIGSNVFLGYFNTLGEVDIGDDVIVGGYVNFISGRRQHGTRAGPEPFWRQVGLGRERITVGSNVWIGSNSCICASVGSSCVIGAGSVVIKATSDRTIYAGNPAKKIGEIA